MSWREWFQKRAKLQALALALAIVAWFLVHSGQTVMQRRSFEVDFFNLAPEMVITQVATDEIQFVLTGSFHRLRSLDPELRTYPVDLSLFGPGKHSLEVDPSNLHLPLDIQASQAQPSRLEFEIEELVTKELPIEIRLQGEPDPEYRIAEVRARPDPIQVTGPRSLVQALERFRVSVSVEGSDRSFSTSELVSFNSSLIESVSSVLVEVELQPANLEQRELLIPVVGDDPSRQLRIDPPEARVRVEGPEELILDEDAFRLWVPVDGLASQQRLRIRGRLDSPDGIRLLELEPESFIVEALD